MRPSRRRNRHPPAAIPRRRHRLSREPGERVGRNGRTDRLPTPHRAAEHSPCTGAGGGRGSDHQRRSGSGGDLLVHADRTARRPLVGARDRRRDHDRGRGRSAAGLRAPSNGALGRTGGRAQTRPWTRIAFTVLAVCAQVARNWLMLHAIGVTSRSLTRWPC